MGIEVTRFRARGPVAAPPVLGQPETSLGCASGCLNVCLISCNFGGPVGLAAGSAAGTVAAYAYATSDFGNEEA